MRTKITVNGNNVTVARDHPFYGYRETTTYFAPWDGGYVRVRDADGRFPQVCEKLASTGPTLWVRSASELPAVIRLELRKLRRWEALELNCIAPYLRQDT